MTDTEVGRLAAQLKSLTWPLLMADASQLAAGFGWTTLSSKPDSVMVDTGSGLAGGRISGRSGYVDGIEVRITDLVGQDDASRAAVGNAFVAAAAAITSAIGAPTTRTPGEFAEIRWAGTETTLRLMDLTVCVKLYLLTNKKLAYEDAVTELDERGQL